jgi:putative salt-induced outer membrane protein YdiY
MKKLTEILTSQHTPGTLLGITTAMLVGCGIASAQGPVAAAPPPPPPETLAWVTTAAAGLTLTRGNSESFLATISLDTKRKWEKDEVYLGASGGYGDSTVNDVNTKNTEFIQGFGQYNHLFTDRFYGGLRLDGQYDGIAGIEYRFKVSPMVGYYLIKNDKMTLAAEAGPSLIAEHLDGEQARAYWAARLAERFDYKLTDSTKLWEALEYLPQVDDWANNYLLNLEVGIDTAINKHWSLRVVFQDQYASQPAAGKKNNDLRLLAGTAYKF